MTKWAIRDSRGWHYVSALTANAAIDSVKPQGFYSVYRVVVR